jgi:hypothetical protein
MAQTPHGMLHAEKPENLSRKRWAIPAALAVGVLAVAGYSTSGAAAPMELAADLEQTTTNAAAQATPGTKRMTSTSSPHLILFTVDDMGKLLLF